MIGGRVKRCDARNLELGRGLEVVVAASLEGMNEGDVLDVELSSRSAAAELPAWARLAGHETIDERVSGNRRDAAYVVRLRRGTRPRVTAGPLPDRDAGMRLRRGSEAHTGDLRDEWPPVRADRGRGLIPLGAVPEAGPPLYDWRLSDRDELWTEEVADLTEKATAAQWDATVDVPWDAAKGLPTDVERAVAQVMTFIAQNEYAALYVPAGFLRAVNPEFVEILLWLASHVHDEARHVEVFTKRAVVGGCHAFALRSTELSLQTLLEQNDFSRASLLLNVLGEGTFLDLLKFVETHAPDAATATAARLAHRDEQRHVHFGIAHVRRVLRREPDARRDLVIAVEERAARLISLTGMNPLLIESLTVMAAGTLQRADIARAADAVTELTRRMGANRVRRLEAAGFTPREARHLSDLHTPNLM